MHTRLPHRQAFTLVEFLALLAVVIVIIGILLPVLSKPRINSQSNVNLSNLQSLTRGSMIYANDNHDRIFSFTWESSRIYIHTTGREPPTLNSQDAAAYETQNILFRSTGRIPPFTGAEKHNSNIQIPHSQLMHLRYSHIVLLDYLTDRQPEPIAASPFDRNLINWQENPLAYLDQNNPFPYGNGFPAEAGYDTDPTWTDPAVMQLWPFASSYQVVPHAWLNDTDPQYTPSPNSPHHMIRQADEDAPLGGRKLTEVAFPSKKVFMYEEFDHTSKKTPLYASDPNARINLAFFDGSVRSELVKEANSAQDPTPTNNPNQIWQQPYLPLDTFPVPSGGLEDTTPLDLRFRWTKDGLAGTDY